MVDARRLQRRVVQVLFEQRWLIVLVLAALAVRVHWNLYVHPPGDFVYSDMRGYVTRAASVLDDPWKQWEYNGFYPFGTHVFLAGVQAIFGRDDFRSIGLVYALIGALEVGFGYALARRVSRFAFVAPLVGLVLVFYYPLIALGGYVLSEVPFSFCLVASTFYLVRMIDTGSRRDAVLAGVFAALGFTVRPQILLSIAFFGVLWLVARKAMPRVRLSTLLWAMAPLLLMIAFSAWRLHYHTGRWGLISENGTFNQVFGRCHNEKIVALPDTPERRRTSFGPPPLIQLAKRTQKLPGVWPQLDPAREMLIEYRGYIGDKQVHEELIADCIQRTGWEKQVEYSFVNALLLWRYNVMWPDSGKPAWRGYAQTWGIIHANAFAIPALIGLLFVFAPRRYPKQAVLSLHIWAIIAVALSYIGGIRFRSPYDPFIILMAVEVVAFAGFSSARWLWARARPRSAVAAAPRNHPMDAGVEAGGQASGTPGEADREDS